ncbi:MAG: putative O-glycosylation ligase, exosortase A system-associated [Comamonadaceae bacterium]|nr:putative O-glycosylation ligase, exosortase A system-associated [Comamonadaceae bacterium]
MAIIVPWALMALRRPWLGVLLWTWLSLMNPHRFTWGFAYTAPVAALAAVCTLVGLLATKERDSPFKGAPAVILALFMAWMTVSWLMGLSPADDYPQWDKVMKINLMVLVTLMLLRTRVQIMAFAWVATFSLALLGIKGGLFTLANGGSYRVWGPEGSFIYDNNHLALALVMTIPLMRFLQLQVQSVWLKHALTVVDDPRRRVRAGQPLARRLPRAVRDDAGAVVARAQPPASPASSSSRSAALLLAFMPGEWSDRIASIGEYQEDNVGAGPALGLGHGVERRVPLSVRRRLQRGASGTVRAVLAEPGASGRRWRTASISRCSASTASSAWDCSCCCGSAPGAGPRSCAGRPRDIPQARWAADLGAMCQVSLVGYAVGGAFLNLAHFDRPYDVMAMVVLARVWVLRRGWETDPVVAEPKRWQRLLGIAPRAPAPPPARRSSPERALIRAALVARRRRPGRAPGCRS